MKKFCFAFSVLFVLLCVLSACAATPAEEMNKARDAVTRAEYDADAVTYAGNTVIRARDALTRMQGEADAKRYDSAKSFAAEAVSLAERAVADGKAGAARAKGEAENIFNSLGGPMAETASALDTARQAGDLILDFGALSKEMDSARDAYNDARQSLQANDYQDAILKSQSVRSTLADINSSLTNAATAGFRKQ